MISDIERILAFICRVTQKSVTIRKSRTESERKRNLIKHFSNSIGLNCVS